MTRRGLTLLEILIAVALVIAIAAIAVPALDAALDRRAFDAAGDVAQHQVLLARAHAQSTGRPVEVLYRAGSRVMEVRLFRVPEVGDESPLALDDSEDDFRLLPSVAASGTNGGAPAVPPEDDRAIPEGWSRRVLPARVRLTDERPAPEGAAVPPAGMAPPLRAREMDRTIRLAVLLPDGSALLVADVWLVDDGGRAAALTINPWTGLPALDPVDLSIEPGTASASDEEGIALEDDLADDAWMDPWEEDEGDPAATVPPVEPEPDDPPPAPDEGDDEEAPGEDEEEDEEEDDAPGGGGGP